jgi:hypothetical protein
MRNLLGKPLMGNPPCTVRETSRYTEASGATVVRYDGADGGEYHCTVSTNGSRTWSVFNSNLTPAVTHRAPAKAI